VKFSQNIGNSIEFTLETKNFLESSQLLCLKKQNKFPKKYFKCIFHCHSLVVDCCVVIEIGLVAVDYGEY
jgi:hypothetical protein